MLKVPIVDMRACDKWFSEYNTSRQVQICAGGEKGHDSCAGDSGGPLVKPMSTPIGGRYFLLGIVSYGPTVCGTKNVPAIYTKVSAYMTWILDNLE